jgi:FkbM family methyltransferase
MSRFSATLFAEKIYTVLLRPKPLRKIANWLLLRVIPQKVKIDGADLFLNPNDPVLSSAVAFGVYEPYEQCLFREVCKPGFTVIDLGANVGLYSVIAAKAGVSQVVSIEPDPESISFLQKTAVENRLSNILPISAACGNRSGMVDLYQCEDNKADSRLYDLTGTRAKIQVEMVRLDDLLDRLKISHVDLIKMDIQGFEALALQGMHKTIQRSPKIKLLCEFWPWGIQATGVSPQSFLDDLVSLGFTFQLINEADRVLTPLPNIQAIAAESGGAEYTSKSLQRSHANLLCTKDS